MPLNFILEIGTEEIPAAPLTGALGDLSSGLHAMLEKSRLGFEGAAKDRPQTVGTPRRITVFVEQLAENQADLSELMVGPPARVAFDESGSPTKAAEGFARKNGVELSELRREEVEGRKGEYVVCTRAEAGRSTIEILAEMIPQLITNLPWPKSMRWGDGGGIAFVRPIQWIACVFGDKVVPFEIAGIKSGDKSRGHRFLHPESFTVSSELGKYTQLLKDRLVIVDPATRAEMINSELRRLERESGAWVKPDPELVTEVANLIEYPVGIVGTFDESFLNVPSEIIISAMRGHQRYFAMEDADGKLVNKFATIAGTITRDKAIVARGNERVLAARLSDAKFFFDEDQKTSLDELAKQLDGVVFQKKLGTVGDKVGRIAGLSKTFAAALGVDEAAAERAARICKADLVSKVVYEFPDLQGTMGRAYATAAGEPAEVAAAIEEHYLPRGAGDSLPTTVAGAVVGLADRIDTIVGGFAAGLAPTGSADQFGLRRAAIGVLHVLLDRQWSLPLPTLVSEAAAQLEGTVAVDDKLRADVEEFFRARLLRLLGELPRDCVEAALAAGFSNVPDAQARAQAVAQLRTRDDFEPLATAFKRVANILKGESSDGEPNPDRFITDDERLLWTTFSEIRTRTQAHLDGGDYSSALGVLAELKAPVDRFFDNVMVIDKDPDIRKNRLALLSSINATFTRIADFRQLAV